MSHDRAVDHFFLIFPLSIEPLGKVTYQVEERVNQGWVSPTNQPFHFEMDGTPQIFPSMTIKINTHRHILKEIGREEGRHLPVVY